MTTAELGRSPHTVGLLVIATGAYLPMALRLADDVARSGSRESCVMNLFTDAPDQVTQPGAEALEVNVVPIGPLRWPEATLQRFELFEQHAEGLVGDVLMYSDADMRVLGPLDDAVDEALATNERLAGVRHPGFYNRGWRGPRGTWETRRSSTAYVPRLRRRAYAAGGLWLGQRASVLGMCSELADHVRRDRDHNVMAVWHDESHWNWYVAAHHVHLLSPAWCFAEDYPWLEGITPRIMAVDKGSDFVRESTDLDALETWQRDN